MEESDFRKGDEEDEDEQSADNHDDNSYYTQGGGGDSEDADMGRSNRTAGGVTFKGEYARDLFNAKLVSQSNNDEDDDEEPRPRGREKKTAAFRHKRGGRN